MVLGLGMIVKNEVTELDSILSKYATLFDEIHITITHPSKKQELEEVCKKYNAVASYYDWQNEPNLLAYKGKKLFPFDKARNYNMAQFKKATYYVRLDSDDELVNPQNLRKLAEEAEASKTSVLYCWYNYSRDLYGAIDAGHYRETIIKITPKIYWNKDIHENILPIVNLDFNIHVDTSQKVSIYHNVTHDKLVQSNKRNIKYLLAEYRKDKEKTDPRTIAYLGRTFHGLGKYSLAKQFLEEHIGRSGWDEDRYQSWCQLSHIMQQLGNKEQAVGACNEAIHERPEYPDAYLQLHDVYFDSGDYKKSIEFAKVGLSKELPTTFTMVDPSRYTWRTFSSLSLCYLHTGDLDNARKTLNLAKSSVANADAFKDIEKLIIEAEERKEYVLSLGKVMAYVAKNEPSKVELLAETIPASFSQHDMVTRIKKMYLKPKVWGERSIVFMCPPVFEKWSPKSVKTGIGGSEEAVIHLAKELKNLGWDVTVYANCQEDEGWYDGVWYIDFSKFNIHDTFNVLIQWRTNLFSHNIKAKHNWSWLHDILTPDIMYVPEDIAGLNKIIVLSEYHKSLLPKFVPQDKIIVSANGLNLEDYNADYERNPYKIAYGSSYDRGLENLLDVWPDIKQAVPQAELSVFYGWQNMVKVAEGDINLRNWINKVDQKMRQPGITHKKRLGHAQVIQEYKTAGIWAYPTAFPEISCISAMKAQICGAVPVCTDFAALKETVKSGVIVGTDISNQEVKDRFKNTLIELLTNHKKQEELRKQVLAKGYEFDWKKVAEQWSKELGTPSSTQQESLTSSTQGIQDSYSMVLNSPKNTAINS